MVVMVVLTIHRGAGVAFVFSNIDSVGMIVTAIRLATMPKRMQEHVPERLP